MKKQARRRKPVQESASKLEMTFWRLWQIQAGSNWPSPVKEYQFDSSRQWRIDFAWPFYQVAVELEGGVHQQGRHTRGSGFIADCEKYNAAALQGWLLLRYTGPDLKKRPVQVITEVLQALQTRCGKKQERASRVCEYLAQPDVLSSFPEPHASRLSHLLHGL